jgi:Xaa-Pro dipeptidase
MSELRELFKQHLEITLKRIEESMSELGVENLVLGSGESFVYFEDDESAPFRTDRHFGWLCPLRGPNHFLRITPGKKPLLARCVPDTFWHEKPEEPETWWSEFFDIETAGDAASGWRKLGSLTRARFVGGNSSFATADGVQVNSELLIAQLNWWRSFKTPYEIECIVEANKLAALGHRAAANAFLDGGSEFDSMLAYLGAVGVSEKDLSFSPTFAIDEKAAILHYEARRTRKGGRVLLVDAGAVCRHYASDISRTTVKQSAHPVFRELWERLNGFQQQVCGNVVVGTTMAQIQYNAYCGIAGILEQSDILRVNGDFPRAVKDGLLRTFLPHNLGHALGVATHDIGDFQINRYGSSTQPFAEHKTYRATRPLEVGQVLTIEPGIYFMPSLLDKMRASENAACFNWNLIDELIPYGGIRIEDDILVGAVAPRNITREFLP